jgi:hypothetical protein
MQFSFIFPGFVRLEQEGQRARENGKRNRKFIAHLEGLIP